MKKSNYKPASETLESLGPLPYKLFYRIGEVSKIIGVKQYVIRYWETEFPFLNPRKSKSGQRVYVKSDIESLLLIKRLLYQERYTIEGVRKKLSSRSVHSADTETNPAETLKSEEIIPHIKKRLREILIQLK